MLKLADDLNLRDAIEIVARVIERTEACRDAVKRAGSTNGVDPTFLILGAEQEIAALNLAMATMLLARGRIEEAADAMGVISPSPTPPSAPTPAPVAPWPIGAQVEDTSWGPSAPRNPTNVGSGRAGKPRPPASFAPAPVSPRTRASAPEIAF